MAGFTKGEWIARPVQTQFGDCVCTAGLICDGGCYIANTIGGLGIDEESANARLIAAAPKLYELAKVLAQAQFAFEIEGCKYKAEALLAEIDGDAG